MQDNLSPAEDRLVGAKAIAMFWCGSDDPGSIRKVRHLVDIGAIPAGREGALLLTSKRRLREVHDSRTGGDGQQAA